jgi:hypothetical protein
MKSMNLKKMTGVAALGLVTVLGMSESASAQGRRNNENKIDRKIERQQDKVEKQQNKLELERLKLQRERLQNQRENLNARNNRFRVNRGGRWYNTDQRGANLLRQAVNAGYQQGFNAGRADRNSRRGLNWRNSSIYRSGTFGYQSHVDRSLYQHYFQQGFERGYQDGYNSRFQYGSNSGGRVNILGTILNSLLNIQQY